MKNFEKYKTAEERINAFESSTRWCGPGSRDFYSAFYWLDKEYKEPIKRKYCAKSSEDGTFFKDNKGNVELYDRIEDLTYSIAYSCRRSGWDLYEKLGDGSFKAVSDCDETEKFDKSLDAYFCRFEMG